MESKEPRMTCGSIDGPPPTRHWFFNAHDELRYLQDKILYWLHGRKRPSRAMRFCNRFEELLRQVKQTHRNLNGLHEYFATLYDLKDDIEQEVWHREREIVWIKRVLNAGGPIRSDRPGLAHIPPIDYALLVEKLVTLACLYYDQGKMRKTALRINEAKELAETHGIKFEDNGLWNELWPGGKS